MTNCYITASGKNKMFVQFCQDLPHIDQQEVSRKTEGLTLADAASVVAYISKDPQYQLLAGRMRHAVIRDQIVKPYSKALLQDEFDKIIDNQLVRFVIKNADFINDIIEQDEVSLMRYNWMSVRTLEKGYIKQYTNKMTGETYPLEDVRYAVMRMAVAIFMNTEDDLANIRRFYNYVSRGAFTPATPTWFHAGTKYPQMKSCFLTNVDDNIESIMTAYTDTALISKEGGGNGVHISNLRHSTVRSSGKSAGVRPWMRMWNEQATAINQGGHRKGAFTFFLAIWHKDAQQFGDCRLQEGNPDFRTKNLNICFWMPDLFFKRVMEDKDWSLFCPAQAPGLTECWGDDFERLYEQYEASNVPRTTVSAKALMAKMCHNMIVCGEPFMMAADASNRKSNQQHDCVHTGSNLCLEIIEKASTTQIAACNLASICLPYFVKDRKFDFVTYYEACQFVTLVLNRVTKVNMYPVERIKHSDDLHNPIGLGTQGFADTLAKMDLAWVTATGEPDPKALTLRESIWACKYYATLDASCRMAMKVGRPYSSFRGSPLSFGKFQFDMWREEYNVMSGWGYDVFDSLHSIRNRPVSHPRAWGMPHLDWEDLRHRVVKYGVVNSLLNADMPTATTGHIQGNMEAFEPFTYNFSTRRVLAGDCYVFNSHLYDDLEEIGLRTPEVSRFLMKNNGSAQGLCEYMTEFTGNLSQEQQDRLRFLERKYLTSYELPVMIQTDFNTVHSPYVCQSSSFNLHMKNPTVNDIFNVVMHRWLSGHKTLAYYTRTESAVDPIKYTVRDTIVSEKQEQFKCEGDTCMMCT